MKRTPEIISAVLLLCLASSAVELNNWRLPYYRAAAEMGLITSSPSGMFWDDIPLSPLFDPLLAADSVLKNNHWWFEPDVSVGMQTPHESGERDINSRLGVLNDIRYGRFLVRQTLSVDSRYNDDPFYPAHRERVARGRIEEAYARVDGSYWFLRFGRLMRNWGPFIDRSFLVSSNPYTYDALEWQVHSSIFEFRQVFAALAPNGNLGATTDNLSGRYLVAHALNLMFGKWGTAGITETMVFRRSVGLPDFQYVNPFSIYTVTNTNQEGSGNLMIGLQCNIHPGIEKLSLRGQLALDDFQVDNEAVGDQEPSHWGIDAGVYWRDPLLLPMHSLLKAGYCRRSEWLYTVPDNNMEAGEGYTFLSKSLGYPKNDGDEIWVGASVIGKTPWVGSAMISYGREGDKNVNSFWFDNIPGNTPGLPFDYAAGQFPSGTVMNTVSFSLEGSAYVCAFADASFMINNRWIKNKNHQATPFVYAPVFSASLGLHLSNLHFALPQ